MKENNTQPVVMTIAGMDPSGGAGILADIKTIGAFGCYGVAAVTSLTLQNTQGVFAAYHQDHRIVRGQIDPLFDDFEIAAIKTGMLPTAEIIEEVAEIISARQARGIVVDPVVRSTSGHDLIDENALAALIRSLFALATVVTPNALEAERITGIPVRDSHSKQKAAEAIFALGPRAVLVKGGDLDDDAASDLLLDAEGFTTYSTKRLPSRNTHGTGCTLAAALACLLARGFSLRESVPVAKRYINEAINNAPGLGGGHGPLNHFLPGFGLSL
jgi:hydroxymethylpyrimidine kinase/phosphomethylpyrimidine kinase